MDYKIVYDTTPAVEASIEAIVHTFVEALILVTLVVFIFLQNIRATIIPLLTIPVSLIGTFIFFPMLGFSVNTLSMFGLVLAIGIVVDDAIVVVEAVIHHLEHGMSPKEATIQAMKEVTAPVIGIALILSAVFVPVAILGGLVGSMYKQFALTIAISVLLSAFNALSLTPALCAMLLKPPKPMRGPLGSFFRGFNKVFDVGTKGYVKVSRLLVRRSLLTIGIVVAVAVGAEPLRARAAGRVHPGRGPGHLRRQRPAARPARRSSAPALVLKKVEDILAKTEGLDSYQTIGGYGAVTSTFQPNYGTIFVRLKPWEERKTAALHVNGIMGGAAAAVRGDSRGDHLPVQHPHDLRLRRRVGLQLPAAGPQRHAERRAARRAGAEVPRRGAAAARAGHRVHLLRPELSAGQGRARPREGAHAGRAGERGLPGAVRRRWAAATSTTSTASVGCIRVYVQADADQRLKAEDIGKIYVRSKTTNEMVPLSTLVTIRDVVGTELTTRFNLQRSVEIQGSPAPGYTSGQALAALEQVFAETMPTEMGFAYSSMSYQEKIAPPAGPTFIMAIVFVFLLLAALYESWRLPWAVLLGSPLVALGAFFGVWLMGFDNNVYVQIGLVMLIGLAAKNAILIVEFAKAKHEEGSSLEEAALESARLRFRPILMTAFAFILGVVPLMLASGAGAGAQNVMGTGVFWGMLVATALGVFIIPGNYTFVEGLGRRRKAQARRAGGRARRRKERMNEAAPALFLPAWPRSLAAGCTTVGPDYQRPELSLPSAYRGCGGRAGGGRRCHLRRTAWWSVFPDPDLRELIRTALEQNYDLRVAAARILQAQSQVTIAGSPKFPTVDGSVERPTAATTGFGPAVAGQQLPAAGGSRRLLGAGLLGPLRRSTEAARAELLATEDGRYAVMATLVAQVGQAYLTLRALDLTLEISRRTVGSRTQSLDLVQARVDGGVAGMLDVRQAETCCTTATKTIPDIQRQIEQTENFINMLLGQNPGPVKRGRPLDQQIAAPALPPGLPTQLLTRRPDIRAAEQQLVAANAQIGVAMALLYPQVTLSGFAGAGSSTISGANFGPYGVFSLLPAVTLPIFNAGRLQANVDFNEAVAQEAALRYQQTLQQALREVSDALVGVRKRQEFREQQELLVKALADASEVATLRYEGGVSSYLEVLDTDRQLFDARA